MSIEIFELVRVVEFCHVAVSNDSELALRIEIFQLIGVPSSYKVRLFQYNHFRLSPFPSEKSGFSDCELAVVDTFLNREEFHETTADKVYRSVISQICSQLGIQIPDK